MQYAAIISAIIAAVGGISSALGGKKAREGSKYAGKMEAKQEQIVTQAKLEDLRVEERVMKGQTIAGAAGSNVKVDMGSPLEVLAEQARNFARERQTVAQAGATKAANAAIRGNMVGQQAAYQGFGQAASGLSSAFQIFAQYG